MPLLKEEAVSRPAVAYISLSRDEKSGRENIRLASNHISILDDDGEIIEQIVPLAKILPTNLQNDQVNERTLLNSVQPLLQGMNVTVLLIGSSFSGKEKLFDGNKNEQPLAVYYTEKLFPLLKQRFRKFQLRMRAGVIVKEKLYDCNSENRYGTLKVRESDWEGVEVVNINTLAIDSADDFKKEFGRAVKQKNRLILEFKDLYTSFLSLTLIRQAEEGEGEGKIVCSINFFEVPGVEILGQSQKQGKNKQASQSTRSLFNFASILSELSRNSQDVPQYDSMLGTLLKQTIGGNSHLVVYYTLRSEDIEGSRSTIKFMKLTDNLQQYPIANLPNTYGLLRKFRAEIIARKGRVADKETEGQKGQIENELMRVKTEEDYSRLLQKYSQLKNKYNQALKAKSQAQLQLIRCEQEKLQIGKSLVEVQIQNTKLLEKLQNKDYQNGKRVMQTENKLAKKQSSYQQCMDKIQELTAALNQALEGKRDLEVEFIALKRNFILQQKEVAKLKQDNQSLSLDVVNLGNENEHLKKDFLGKARGDDRSRLVLDMQNEKFDELKRENKRQEDTIAYLTSEIQRYKKELIERQVNFQQKASRSGLSGYGKDYDRIQLENENLQLQNRLKLLQRRVEQMEEKVGFYEQENATLQEQQRKQRAKEINDTNQYRKKLEELAKTTNYESIVKELRDNFAKKDAENLARINTLKKVQTDRKKEIASLKSHMRQLMALLEEWSPKGADLPAMRKFRSLDLGPEDENDEVSELRIKNMRLEEEVRRLKASGGTFKSSGGRPNEAELKESRVQQQYNYLKGSHSSKGELDKLRDENTRLAQQNRRLTIMLKDGNKMDLNVIKRQNDALRKQVDQLRNQNSVSPSTNDQKLIYYEKHMKALERQRSELLSRCVVAEEQVKSMLSKMGRAKP